MACILAGSLRHVCAVHRRRTNAMLKGMTNNAICCCTRSSCFPALSSSRCRSAASWTISCCVAFAAIAALFCT